MSTRDDEIAKAVRKVGSSIVSLTRALAALNGLLSPGHALAAMTRACCTLGYGIQQAFNLHRELEPPAEQADGLNVPLPFDYDAASRAPCRDDDIPFQGRK
jgi:hypothetical protein